MYTVIFVLAKNHSKMSNSSEGEEDTSNISDQTYVKPVAIRGGGAASKLPKNTQPPYLTMVQEAVIKLSEGLSRGGTVSRTKISDYIQVTYGLHDVSSTPYFKKAIKIAVEKNIIENTSGWIFLLHFFINITKHDNIFETFRVRINTIYLI